MILLSSKNLDMSGMSAFEKEISLGGSCNTESCLDWLNINLVSSLLSIIDKGLMASHFRPARHCHIERVPAS